MTAFDSQTGAAPAFQAQMSDGTACGIQWSVGSLQGHRPTMEDAHMAMELPGLPGYVVLGVFDGHGGSKCAKVCPIASGAHKTSAFLLWREHLILPCLSCFLPISVVLYAFL